ncbi:MAG: hypothetical protein RTU92_11110 [Candidatus Thorarchaeota archaeon]
MKRVHHLIVLTLFLAGFLVVPSTGVTSPSVHLQDVSEPTTITNEIAALPNDRVFRVALYNETNSTIPSYASGGVNTNYSYIFDFLVSAGFDVTQITEEDILNNELNTVDYDVLVLADNLPRPETVDLTKEFWLAGGGILSIDSAAAFLGYAGILPRETEGVSDGFGVYWSYPYESTSNITVRNPVTQSYAVGDQLTFMLSDWCAYIWSALSGTTVASDITILAIDDDDADHVTALSMDPSDRGGKVVQLGIPVHSWAPDWEDMIVDAISWLAPRPKAKIAYDMSHSPYYGIDAWDTLSWFKPKYVEWRDRLVSQGYTVDKFYPSAAGNLTSDRLEPFDILIEVLPRINFTVAEVGVVETWIGAGNGLLVMGDNAALDQNEHVNHLVEPYPMYINRTVSTISGLSDFINDLHPTAEDVSQLDFSAPGIINFTGEVVPLVGSAEGEIVIAAYEHLAGRVILISDINWIEDVKFMDASNRIFASNIINWLSVGEGDVLLYLDYSTGPNYFRSYSALALNQLDIDFYLTTNMFYLNLSMHSQDWSLVIIAEASYDAHWIYDDLKNYIDNGGRVIMNAWSLNAFPTHPLWAAFGVEYASNRDNNAPTFLWEPSHAIFSTPIDYNALTFNQTLIPGDAGDNVQPLLNATALAGTSALPSGDTANIVLRKDGQTLLNSIILDLFGGDADDSAYIDAFEIWMDEIYVMLNLPTIDHPSDFTMEGASTGHEFAWNPNHDSPNTYEILVDGVSVESGSWDGTAISYDPISLELGVHGVELFVYGNLGSPVSDLVVVTVVDTTNPLINSPDDMSVTNTSTGNTLTWVASDAFPDAYVILMNATPYSSGDWDGSDVTLDLDALEVGAYFFTIRINDTSGNLVEDTVLVTVTQGGGGIIGGLDTTTLLIIVGAVVVLIIIIVIIKKRKK